MIVEKYLDFMKELNRHRINWCLIKDYEYLMRHGYDNEIDLIAYGKDRERIRKIARKNKWHESALNSANTHLIFWKFECLKPFRIDIHIDKALATAVPWLKAEDIVADKVRNGDIWHVSSKYELAILLLSSFRGRTPKSWRIKRAKELRTYLDEAKKILGSYLTYYDVEKYYDYLVRGKIVRLLKLKRLGILGIIKECVLIPRLLFCRMLKPARILVVSNGVSESLIKILKDSKLNVKKSKNPIMRLVSDIVIRTDDKNSSDIKKIINNISEAKNVY
ncbi:TPA: hypothetical protein HA219_02225 [Candidatus Woesearchaeota archaeon]|nr:hypothetical protein [Candidatus Woesearchaeota archaeon]HIH39517.1 hypothetical protein [Candidatus Woesearchaeota archaeon]